MKIRLTSISKLIQFKLILFIAAAGLGSIFIQSCSSPSEKSEATTEKSSESGNLMKDAEEMEDDGFGFGPVKNISIPATIDESMAAEGLKHFEAKCTACHKFSTEKYVGPGLADITKRRKPEWIMNMILNPLEMTQRDPVAKELFATLPNTNDQSECD